MSLCAPHFEIPKKIKMSSIPSMIYNCHLILIKT